MSGGTLQRLHQGSRVQHPEFGLMDMKVMDFRRQVHHLPRLMDRGPAWSERQADECVGRIEGRHRDVRPRDDGPILVDLLVAETE